MIPKIKPLNKEEIIERIEVATERANWKIKSGEVEFKNEYFGVHFKNISKQLRFFLSTEERYIRVKIPFEEGTKYAYFDIFTASVELLTLIKIAFESSRPKTKYDVECRTKVNKELARRK